MVDRFNFPLAVVAATWATYAVALLVSYLT